MTLSDFPYAPEEAPEGAHDESFCCGPGSSHSHRRSDSAGRPGLGERGPGERAFDARGKLDWNLPPSSVLDRLRRDTPDRAVVPDAAPTSRRYLLWEVWDGYHCSICGTCLSFAELLKIAGKAGLQFEDDENEYGIHGHFVQLSAKPGRVAKLVQKFLDRKYRNAVDRFRRAKSEAQITALWSDALAKGDVPGPYWALMTHPRSTPALRSHAFGEVHMLSHLVGATNRADIRRLRDLEDEQRTLNERLDAARHQSSEREAEHRRLASAREAEVRKLTDRLQAAQAVELRLEQAEARLREFENDETVRVLRAHTAALESDLDETRRLLQDETVRRATLEHELSTLRTAHEETRSTLRALGSECDALESMLESGIDHADSDAGASVRPGDLYGRRVAYVGGRVGIVDHFRALAERLNGHFIHHDGGIEDHEGQLGRILVQADVVLCPVDCVSHRAYLRAKRFCKRTAKPFVPLRTAGLSSFASGLRQATELLGHDQEWQRA